MYEILTLEKLNTPTTWRISQCVITFLKRNNDYGLVVSNPLMNIIGQMLFVTIE